MHYADEGKKRPAKNRNSRRQQKRDLSDSEAAYRLLFESNPLPMWVCDSETLAFVAVNEAAVRHYGHSREEFLQMTTQDIRAREDPSAFPDETEPKENVVAWSEGKHRKKDGTIIDVETTSRDLSFAGRPCRLVLANDITERKRIEGKIRFQARLLDAVGQAVIATDMNGTVVYWNRFAELLYDWPAAEALGRNILEITPAEASKDDASATMSRLMKGESWSGEFLVRRRDGSVFPALVTNSPIYDDGEPAGIVCISRDITGRKQMEEARRESEDLYRDLVEHSRDLICTHDLNGLILSANRAAEKMLGYDPKDFIGKKSIRDILAPEFRDQFDDYLDRIRRDGAASGTMIVQTIRGEKRIWEYSNSLRTEGVPMPIVRGMAHDITERWRAQTALGESQARLAGIVESAMDAIITIDETRRIVLFNAAAEKMFGCPEAEAIGQPISRFLPEQFSASPGKRIPIEGSRAGGKVFPIEASISQTESGKHRLCTVIIRDITERQRAEMEREQLITQLRDALAKIKTLTGLLPICANCKKIRDTEDTWTPLEVYIKSHSEAEFSHGICPECARVLYPELNKDENPPA